MYVLYDDFSDGDYTKNPTWTVLMGTWQVVDHHLRALPIYPDINDIQVAQPTAYGIWEWRFRHTNSIKHFWIYFIGSPQGRYELLLNLDPDEGPLGFWFFAGHDLLATWQQVLIPNQWYAVKITRDTQGTFRFYINGTLKLTCTNNAITQSTYMRLCTAGDTDWDDFRVQTPLIPAPEFAPIWKKQIGET